MNTLKEKLKKLYSFGQSIDDDWRKVVVISLIITLLIILWSVVFFVNVQSTAQNSEVSPLQSVASSSKGDQLKELVHFYQAKQDALTALLGGLPAVSSTSTASTTAAPTSSTTKTKK